MNPAAEGKRYPPVSAEVSADRLEAFRAVFGIDAGVPPTFATTVEYEAFVQAIHDPELALDFSRVVHGSQEFEHVRPLRPGETVTVSMRVEAIRVKGTTAFLTLVTDVTDEGGALVCTARSHMVERQEA